MTWEKLTQFLVLTFVSFQGVLLLCVPDIRNRLYETFAQVSPVTVPLLNSIAEHGRLLVSVALIPTFFLPRNWIIMKFVSLISYVFYVCIIYNLYMFHTYFNIAQFLFHLLVLTKYIFIIVDDLTNLEFQERKRRRRRSIELQSQAVKVSPQKARAQKVEQKQEPKRHQQQPKRHQQQPKRKR